MWMRTHTHKHTHTHTHTNIEFLCSKTCTSANNLRTLCLSDRWTVWGNTRTRTLKHVQKHTFISQGFYFVYFLLAKHQKANAISHHTDKQQYYNSRYSTIPFSNAPPLTTCGMGWRKRGFKQTDMNTQQIPPTANKICMAEDDYL